MNDAERLKEIEGKIDKDEGLTKEEEGILMKEPSGKEESNLNSPTPPKEEPEKTKEPEKKPEETEELLKDFKASTDVEGETEEEKTARIDTEKQDHIAKKKKEKEEKPEKTQKETEKEEGIDFTDLNKELEKPEGQEDLTKFSKREVAYFWEMRRLRRRSQSAEKERDQLKFEKIKRDKTDQETKDKAKEKEEEDKDDRDETDVATVKDIRDIKKIVKELKKTPTVERDTTWRDNFLHACDDLARTKHDDYDEVMECTPELIDSNDDYKRQIAETIKSGGNPAEKMYQLIKGDPNFTKVLPIAQARLKVSKGQKTPEKTEKEEEKKEPEKSAAEKEKEARDKEEQIEKNKNKPKTSGHHGGGEGTKVEPTLESITAMSSEDFGALPKATRDKYLKEFGG